MELKEIPIDKITPHHLQPRELFDEGKIKELAASIEIQGLLQPIIVRKNGDGYQIIAGERRWRAFLFLKKTVIPSIVRDIKNDVIVAEKSLIENWQREDLTSVEKENMVSQIKEMGGYTYRELGNRMGISHTQVRRYIKAKEDRENLEPAGSISTRDLNQTRGLDDKTRKWLLGKLQSGEISKHNPEKVTKILKNVPESVKKAIVSEKVDIEDVATVMDTPISKEMEGDIIREFTKRKKDRDDNKKVTLVTDRMILKSELKPKPRIIWGQDTQRRDKLQRIRNIYFFTSEKLSKKITNKEVQADAIRLMTEIRDIATNMLEKVNNVSIDADIDVEGDHP